MHRTYNHGDAPSGVRPDPEETCDETVDAANMIAAAMTASFVNGVRSSDECLDKIRGEYVEFELPRLFVKLRRNSHADLMAQWALERGAMLLEAAARQQLAEREKPRPSLALRACAAAIEATGGSQYWNGETKAFLELCEAAVAEAAELEAAARRVREGG